MKATKMPTIDRPFARLKIVIEVEDGREFAPQAAAYRLAHLLSRRGHHVGLRHVGGERPRLTRRDLRAVR
jgi:hypothetical protein